MRAVVVLCWGVAFAAATKLKASKKFPQSNAERVGFTFDAPSGRTEISSEYSLAPATAYAGTDKDPTLEDRIKKAFFAPTERWETLPAISQDEGPDYWVQKSADKHNLGRQFFGLQPLTAGQIEQALAQNGVTDGASAKTEQRKIVAFIKKQLTDDGPDALKKVIQNFDEGVSFQRRNFSDDTLEYQSDEQVTVSTTFEISSETPNVLVELTAAGETLGLKIRRNGKGSEAPHTKHIGTLKPTKNHGWTWSGAENAATDLPEYKVWAMQNYDGSQSFERTTHFVETIKLSHGELNPFTSAPSKLVPKVAPVWKMFERTQAAGTVTVTPFKEPRVTLKNQRPHVKIKLVNQKAREVRSPTFAALRDKGESPFTYAYDPEKTDHSLERDGPNAISNAVDALGGDLDALF